PDQSVADPHQGHRARFRDRPVRHHPAGRHRRPRHARGVPVLRRRLPHLSRPRHPVLGGVRVRRALGRQGGARPMSAPAAPDSAAVERPPPPARGWPRQRIAGYALMALWIVVGLGLVAYLVSAYDAAMFARYAPSYLSGLKVTLQLVGLSVLLGALLSAPVAWARTSRNPWLAWPAYAYVYFFRGTPLLAQAFLIYYGM